MIDRRIRFDWLRGFLRVVIVVGLLVVATTSGVSAQTTSNPASIVVFKLEGTAGNAELRGNLTRVIRDQVSSNARYALVNDDPVALSDVIVVLGCSSISTTCLGKAADHFDADFLVFGKIEQLEGRNRVSVRLFDPGAGRYVRSFGRVMSKMSAPYDQFRGEVDKLLLTEEQRAETQLRVTSNIKGASVKVNGEPAGETPLVKRGIEPGRYRVIVEKKGYNSWSTIVDLKKGAKAKVRAPLQEEAAEVGKSTSQGDGSGTTSETAQVSHTPEASGLPSERRSDSGSISTWGPWAVVALGALSFGGSAISWAKVEETHDDLRAWRAAHPDDPKGEVETKEEADIISRGNQYDTYHKVFIGIGSAAVAGGLIWFVVNNTGDTPRRASRSWKVGVSPNGFTASWQW